MTKQGSNLLILLKNPKLMILNLFDEFLSTIVSSTSKQYLKPSTRFTLSNLDFI